MHGKKTAAVLYSGGKDSTRACCMLMNSGYQISCLITIRSKNPESYMLHTSNIEMTRYGARALGIPIVYGESSGEKEKELDDISDAVLRAKSEFGFKFLATGALSSRYQNDRVKRIAVKHCLRSLSPLWRINQTEYMRSLVREGFSYVLTSVSCGGLDSSYLGRTINMEMTESIIQRSTEYGFNPAFEGGEAETLVLDCPIFSSRIEIRSSRVNWDGYRGSLQIESARLYQKSREHLSLNPKISKGQI